MSPKLLNILLLILPLVLYYGYIDPAYSGATGLVWTPEASIAVLKSQKAQYENSLTQADLVETEVDKITKAYFLLDKEIKNKVEIMLPDTIDQFKLRNEVMSIANKKGLALSGLKVTLDTGNKNPKIGGYMITFLVKGDYASIKNLIEAYEKSLRLFLIDDITISSSPKKDDKGVIIDENDNTLESTISFKVFYLKP
jgi:hypothetical protein